MAMEAEGVIILDQQPCPECEGTGHFDEIRDGLKCEVCGGTGRIPGTGEVELDGSGA